VYFAIFRRETPSGWELRSFGSTIYGNIGDIADAPFMVLDPFGRIGDVLVTTRIDPTGVQPRLFSEFSPLGSPTLPFPTSAGFYKPGKPLTTVTRFFPRSVGQPSDVGFLEGLEIIMSHDGLIYDDGEPVTSGVRFSNFDSLSREIVFADLHFTNGILLDTSQRGDVVFYAFTTKTTTCGALAPCMTYLLTNATTGERIRQFSLSICRQATSSNYYSACANSFVFIYKEQGATGGCSVMRIPADNPMTNTTFLVPGAFIWDQIICTQATPSLELNTLFSLNGANPPTIATYSQTGAIRPALGDGRVAVHLNPFDGRV
jgi:hypothetical protein